MPLGVLVSLFTLVFLVEGLFYVTADAVEYNAVKLPTLIQEAQGIELYDRKDHFICTIHADKDCCPVPLSKISVNLRNALVSTEDRRFYRHMGIDPVAIARAYMANRKAGRVVEGASTLTQQLVRNLYLDKNDRSYTRKAREVLMALNVNCHYSKAKVLEAYLNEVYFGGGVYGAERAAQHYFNKHASQLSIPESAFLVGLIKSPTTLSDPDNLEPALKRQQVVLKNMEEEGYINKAELEKASTSKLAFQSGPHALRYPHYIAYAVDVLKRQLGDRMWTQSWKVYTNLDVDAQKLAEKTLNESIKHAPKGVDQAALVTTSLKDGAVLAMVGGVGKYSDSQFNRAIAPHTAGSIFKPFVYLTGLMQNLLQPDTLINDSPIEITAEHAPSWKPKNFDGKYLGWIPVRTALMFSRNACAVRVAQAVGIDSVIRTAHSAGITSQLQAYPSLALGSCALTPFEVNNAYATLARGGIYSAPQLLRSIKFKNGQDFRTFQPTQSANFQSEEICELRDVLQDVVRRGTGTLAALPGIAVAGKTGTADSSKDLWFVGFTPDTVSTIWGGNDQNKPISDRHATGGTVMAKIWHDYMTAFYKNHKSPKGETFIAANHELIRETPQYSDNYLLAHSDSDDAKASSNGEANTNSSETNRIAKSIKETGIARAFEIQKLNALQRYQAAVARNLAQQNMLAHNAANSQQNSTMEIDDDSNDNEEQNSNHSKASLGNAYQNSF